MSKWGRSTVDATNSFEQLPPSQVLNHTSGQISGVAAIYNRFQYLEERKAALNVLGRFVETLIGRDIGNVVPLRA